MTWYRKIWRFKSNNNKQQVFSNLETCCLTQNGLLIFSLPSILYPFVNHLFYPMRGTLNGYQFARHAYLSMNAISFFKYLPLPPLSMFFIIAVSENLCKHGNGICKCKSDSHTDKCFSPDIFPIIRNVSISPKQIYCVNRKD